MRGAYTWNNTSVEEKVGLTAGDLYAWGGGGGLQAEKYVMFLNQFKFCCRRDRKIFLSWSIFLFL